MKDDKTSFKENPRHPRRVVCAAIRAKDGTFIVGVRHDSLDMSTQIALRKDGPKFADWISPIHGFVDQYGDFLGPYEAYEVAVAAGQIKPKPNQLYSEDLY